MADALAGKVDVENAWRKRPELSDLFHRIEIGKELIKIANAGDKPRLDLTPVKTGAYEFYNSLNILDSGLVVIPDPDPGRNDQKHCLGRSLKFNAQSSEEEMKAFSKTKVYRSTGS